MGSGRGGVMVVGGGGGDVSREVKSPVALYRLTVK